ncbi:MULTISPECIES: hypothetical protein [Chryseobacterium group]|jgi:hypothetical protein|uniref:DUF3945 domain-containing protein n=5 Tax=Chryseobacterium TaxID=59732 RepID=A0AAJ1R412_9FLAO|nr:MULTISPECIES: hypothetical protein [Chryseobacterium group]EFK33181.1 hypothetical protein HMPREF0204_12249 [Chryseobacterium gleum ATCC 35910]MDN4013273.1 hypothetical protein [Chryseobacterium gambrini]MDN4028873.1 hypothetical protein [Chryseobacterium gambrini]MDO3425167.1 hypothetical protein [Chryseobacterium sp. APV1]QQY33991.1 hypothetical protein I6I60_09600 [Chryseobacterium gleum]
MENTSTLLTDELRKFGIMNQQDHFSEKLSKKEIDDFLKGGILIAENDKNRLTFKINDDKLDVNVYNKDIVNHKDLSTAELFEISSSNRNLYKVMADYGNITHIGTGYFNKNPENEMTTFVEIENERGKTIFFGNKLEDSLKDFKVGDKIQIIQTGVEKTVLKIDDADEKELAKFDNVFIINPFKEKNKQFQSRIFELDKKDNTIKDVDTTKYELKNVNGHNISEKQLQQLRKGKELKLDDETTIQISPASKNEAKLSASSKSLLILSLATDGGLSFLIIKGIQKLARMQEENQLQKESIRYQVELQKLKAHLKSKSEQYPDNKNIITDLNIVSKEISASQSSLNENTNKEKEKSNINLQVNDPDMYQDANQKKEEEKRDAEEASRSTSHSRGR